MPGRIPRFRPNGSIVFLDALTAGDIDLAEMAGVLSRINRFDGHTGYSVAQHCVLGADALFHEQGDAVLAGFFLLHDGHEYLLGDWTRPTMEQLAADVAVLYAAAYPRRGDGADIAALVKRAREAAKARIDALVWQAAGLPDLARMPAYGRQVADMDERMLRAEGIALFGPRAAEHLPAAEMPAPKGIAIRPWGAMKAEEAFVERLQRYLGIHARAS